MTTFVRMEIHKVQLSVSAHDERLVDIFQLEGEFRHPHSDRVIKKPSLSSEDEHVLRLGVGISSLQFQLFGMSSYSITECK